MRPGRRGLIRSNEFYNLPSPARGPPQCHQQGAPRVIYLSDNHDAVTTPSPGPLEEGVAYVVGSHESRSDRTPCILEVERKVRREELPDGRRRPVSAFDFQHEASQVAENRRELVVAEATLRQRCRFCRPKGRRTRPQSSGAYWRVHVLKDVRGKRLANGVVRPCG